jgi:hypothetical protein
LVAIAKSTHAVISCPQRQGRPKIAFEAEAGWVA